MSEQILFYLIIALFPLLFGSAIFVISIWPVLALLLSAGIYRKWLLVGFTISFTFFRLALSLLIKIGNFSSEAVQYAGLFFLVLFALALIFGLMRDGLYAICLGFVWSFWVGLFKAIPTDYYEPKWIGGNEIYLALVSSFSAATLLWLIGLVLSLFNFPKIEKVSGVLTLVIAALMAFHIIKVAPRDNLRPEEPPPKKLYEIFNLPPPPEHQAG